MANSSLYLRNGARRTQLLWNTNRNSYALYRMVLFLLTLSDSSVSERPAHRRTCPTTAFRPPVPTLDGTCIPPTVNCLQYTSLPAENVRPAVEPFQLPAPQSGTLSQISSGTQPSVQTLSDVCLNVPVHSTLVPSGDS